MKITELMRAFNIDRIIGMDAETFYDTGDKYSLKSPSMSNTDYIYDPRFELQVMAVRADNAKVSKSMTESQFKAWAKTINWARTGVLAHHAQFDGFIMSHHYKIKPACFFDTMSMARPLMPIQTGVSLDAVDRVLGGKGKEGTEALVDVDGVHLKDMTKLQIANLQKYNCWDVDKLWYIFHKMLPFIPLHELKLIDRTVRMYTDPTLLVDIAAITPVLDNDVANKIALVKKLKLVKPIGNHQAAKELLSSADSFANLLREAGVEPQKKVSVKKTETARKKDPFAPEISNWAFSKQDQWFKDLEAHESKRVRDLMAARFAVMSNNIEKRCERLISRAHVGPQPVYLKYYGARPGRWSGGDLVNWQNLSSKRREGGEELRASVHAPPGYVLLIADLSQIEARLNAWDAGQVNILDLFAAKQDVYRYVAAGIFNKPVDKVTDGERFIAKTCIAEGELVLTDHGLIPIEKVKTFHRVWDGIEWVQHDGVAYMGERSVITYQGLTATEDHEVFVEEGRKISFGAAACEQVTIAITGSGRHKVRLGQGDRVNNSLEERLAHNTSAMRGMSHDQVDQLGQFAQRQNIRMSGLLATATNTYVAIKTIVRREKSLYQFITSTLGQLRSARDNVRFPFGNSSWALGAATFGATTRYGAGPNKEQQELCARKPSLGDTSAAGIKSAQHPNTGRLDIQCCGMAIHGSHSTPQAAPTKIHSRTNIGTSEAIGSGKAEELATSRKMVRVYDILNAGPRHRFTVSNLLVSNCVLALGYQAGVKRFVHTVRIGAFGPALDISYRDGEDIHTAWRQTNSRIVQNWKTTQNNVRSAFFGCQQIKHGVMTYEGKRTSRGLIGFQHGPTGMNIRYDDVRPASEGNGFKYLTEYHEGQKGTRTDYTGLYGGILVQNKLEHLGRIIIAEQMLELCEYLPKAKMCMTTHDELVMAVPERQGNKALKAANAIMSRPPTWAKGLPLAVDAHISARYDK